MNASDSTAFSEIQIQLKEVEPMGQWVEFVGNSRPVLLIIGVPQICA